MTVDADAFAALICDWCLEAQPGQQVLISTTTLAQDPALALHRALLGRGAWPLLRLAPPSLQEDFYTHAGPAQLDAFAPLELAEIEAVDAVLRIDAPANTRALAGIDPDADRPRREGPRTRSGGAPGAALVRHAVADRRARPASWHERARLLPPSPGALCSSTDPTRRRPGRS